MLGSYKEKFTLRNSNSELESLDIKPKDQLYSQLVNFIKLIVEMIKKRI